MPNVMTPNTVSFGGPQAIIAPDIAAQQLQLSRQQQLVDLLKQKAITPDEQQTVTGAGPTRVVPQSPLQGLTKVLSAYLSGQSQDNIDQKNLSMSREMAQRMAQILNGSAPASVAGPAALGQGAAQQPSQPQPDGSLKNTGGIGPTVANAARMDTMTQGQPAQSGGPQGNDFSLPNLLRGSVIEQMGGAPAASAYWDRTKLPEGVKTGDIYGVPRAEMAAGLRREQAAKGQTMVREGSTVTQTMPDGSIAPIFTAPDLKQGANITWQGGAPVAAPIQGLRQINAGMAGAQTAATEAEKAARDMVTVNTPQGPRMMTRAQAVQMAQGGAPAAGGAPIVPPAAVPPQAAPTSAAPARPANAMAAQPGDADKALIFSNEMKAAQGRLAAAKTPEERQRAQNDIAGLGREMKTAGIPLQTEGQQKFEQTAGANQANLLDDGYKKAKIAADDLMGIDQSRKALQGGTFVGSTAEAKLSIAKFINANIPGVNIAPEKVTNTDYLKSTLGKGLLEQAKTLGSNPSNADANRINDIVGSIGKDPQALAKILDWRQQMSERAIQMHNTNVGQAVKNGFQPQFDMTVRNPVNTSEIDSLLKKYGAK